MIDVYAVEGEILQLGRRGEKNARRIHFDVTRFLSSYGPQGVFEVEVCRSGESEAYYAAVEVNGTDAVWIPSEHDTAAAGTSGRACLVYHVGGGDAKSYVWRTCVLYAPGDPENAQGVSTSNGCAHIVDGVLVVGRSGSGASAMVDAGALIIE